MSCVSVKRIAPEIEGGRWFHGWGNVNTGSSVKWVVSAGVVWSLRQSVGCEPGAELSETFWRQPSFLFGWKFDLYFIGTEKKHVIILAQDKMKICEKKNQNEMFL